MHESQKKKHKGEEKKKAKEKQPRKEEEHTEPAPYFGVPLETIVEREGRHVPLLAEKSIEYLLYHGVEEEGIMRISGSMAEISKLREDIEAGKSIAKMFDGSVKRDPNAVAGLLKTFFRELPEPLISKELNEGATAVLAYGEGPDVLEEIRTIVYSLPLPNFELFKLLVFLLIQVASHSDKNKMTANNLLRVVTPTVHCIPGFLSLAMENYDYFFPEDYGEEESVSQSDVSEGQQSESTNGEQHDASHSPPLKKSEEDKNSPKDKKEERRDRSDTQSKTRGMSLL